MSWMNDTNNWSIDINGYNFINYLNGSFTTNRFAVNLNGKVENFNSKFFCPGTSELGWVICHIKLCKAKGALLMPVWLSSYIWSLIYPRGKQIPDVFKEFTVIKPFYYSEKQNSAFIGFA